MFGGKPDSRVNHVTETNGNYMETIRKLYEDVSRDLVKNSESPTVCRRTLTYYFVETEQISMYIEDLT